MASMEDKHDMENKRANVDDVLLKDILGVFMIVIAYINDNELKADLQNS